MNEQQLRQMLERFNRRQTLRATFIGAGSILLWAISYGLVLLFVILITVVVFRQYPHLWLVNLITVGVMMILVFDALRYRGELFDLHRYQNSIYSFDAGVSVAPMTLGHIGVNPLSAGFGIGNILLCAPRATIAAIRHFRMRTHLDDHRLRDAVGCLEELCGMRDWVDMARFGDRQPALRCLVLLELVWSREQDSVAQVKLDPTARKHLATAGPEKIAFRNAG